MKTALINASPKESGSASKALLSDLKSLFLDEHTIKEFLFHTPNISEEEIKDLCNYSTWVFAFPLYVDGIPSQLLSCLCEMEQLGVDCKNIRIYAIVNCGFYEGKQACNALAILKNWCDRTGLIWGTGIGFGGGGSLVRMQGVPVGSGPKGTLGKVFQELISAILSQSSIENMYTSIGFPKFLYKVAAEIGWKQMITANGGKKKDLKRRM
ncbi:MAG TPA: NAD(P)H-dependent oxidoreductase [Clostridiaceae bacterium]|nr:NAD(P)H-dependent oxidoreductase [Clostridiaceae bacterium]